MFEIFAYNKAFYNEIDLLMCQGFRLYDYWHNEILNYEYCILMNENTKELITVCCDFLV